MEKLSREGDMSSEDVGEWMETRSAVSLTVGSDSISMIAVGATGDGGSGGGNAHNCGERKNDGDLHRDSFSAGVVASTGLVCVYTPGVFKVQSGSL